MDMRIKLTKRMLVAFSLGVSLNLSAKTVYVDVEGNDSNDGSQSMPFKTFQRANQVLEPGDTLLIGGGEYHQTMNISPSGTADKPIVIRAKDDEKVVIKATNSISGWSRYAGDIYQASLSMDITKEFRQLYYNDELMQIARWPNDTDNNPYTLDASVVTTKGTTSSINTESLPDIDFNGALIWYLGQHSGTSWTRSVTGNTDSSISFTEFNPNLWPFSNHTPAKFTTGGGFGRFYVFNKFAFLDNAREWFYDNETQVVYFQTVDGNAPADGAVEYAQRKNTIVLNGSYIDIAGIDVMGGFIQINGQFNRFAEATVTHGLQRIASADTDSGATVFEGAILVIGQNNVIENNTIKYGSANGIAVAGFDQSGNNTRIENNVIQYFNTLGMHTSPIRSAADNVRILKNTISHTARDGIFAVGVNSEIAYNDVSVTGLINNDGGPFYTVGNSQHKNIEVHHNWFHDAAIIDFHDNRIAGIYLDNDSKGFLVHHNVVWNMPWSGVQLNWDNWDNHIYHNTFVGVGQAMGEWINGRSPRDNRVWNNYSDTPDWIHSDAYDLDSNLIEATPLQLVDPNSKNFMPNSSSFLFDQARTIDGFNKPFVGPAPDIGAYEAGGTPWTAGVDAIVDVCGDCESDPNSPPIFDPVDPVDPVEPGEPVQPAIELIDRERFTTDTFTTADELTIAVNYEAGTGSTISTFNAIRGVRFFLRELGPGFVPVEGKQQAINDESAIGQQTGQASATFSLAGLTPTADLPEGHFYQLYVVFRPSGADSNVTVGAINLDIVAAEVKGDWDQDLDVDNADIRALMSAVLARQTIDMSFDINEDGLVNMLDVRALAASCTRTNCATN